jgi:hypothetical protein
VKLLIPLAFAAFVVYALSSVVGGCANCLMVLLVLACLPMIVGGLAKGTRDLG